MQTFLPYPDFKQSASVLDDRRLGKQRVEALQILQTLHHGSRWSNHPAVRMWRGYENALVEYGLAICDEWIARGFKDTCRAKIAAFRTDAETVYPFWLGWEEFHYRHRSRLIWKDMKFYKTKFPNTNGTLDYWWPA